MHHLEYVLALEDPSHTILEQTLATNNNSFQATSYVKKKPNMKLRHQYLFNCIIMNYKGNVNVRMSNV